MSVAAGRTVPAFTGWLDNGFRQLSGFDLAQELPVGLAEYHGRAFQCFERLLTFRNACDSPVQFRALRPIFDTAPFTVAGAPEGDDVAKVWVVDPEGFLAMDGQVGFG